MHGHDLRETGDALKAASEPTRLRILKLIESGELCVCQLTAVLGLSQPAISQHLRVLRQAGLAVERKEGRYSYYRLSDSTGVARALHELVAGLSEDDAAIHADRVKLGMILRIPVERLCSRSPGVKR